MRALLTGAAGFVGSHLAGRLIADGFEVVGVDNLLTGSAANLEHLTADARFDLLTADASVPLDVGGRFDWVLHFASPASPAHYLAHPLETLRVNGEGTRHLLELAHRTGARFLLASSSEVYGDPTVIPQTEDYHGNVSTTGPRSVYREAKRHAETLTAAHARARGVEVRIARIFNTYGPRLGPNDGRVVSTFVSQALRGVPLTVKGDGRQTRSFQYIDDLIEGIRRLMEVDYAGPVNLGMPTETTIGDLARLALEVTRSASPVESVAAAPDDPRRRCPDISLARRLLDWEPVVPLREGLARTAEYLRTDLAGETRAVRATNGAPSTGT